MTISFLPFPSTTHKYLQFCSPRHVQTLQDPTRVNSVGWPLVVVISRMSLKYHYTRVTGRKSSLKSRLPCRSCCFFAYKNNITIVPLQFFPFFEIKLRCWCKITNLCVSTDIAEKMLLIKIPILFILVGLVVLLISNMYPMFYICNSHSFSYSENPTTFFIEIGLKI